jgi:hypothetical protein
MSDKSTIHLNVPAELKGRLLRASRAALMKSPTPEQIKISRIAAGHTQEQAAALIYKSVLAWNRYEAGSRSMDPAYFELYLIKTQQNTYTISLLNL